MSTTELSEELERTIAEHDLTEEHAIRVRELVDTGVPVLDAIRQAGEEQQAPEPPAEPSADPAAGLDEPTPKMLKTLQRETERYHAKVRAIMGGFVEGFVDCSTCGGIGLEPDAPKAKTHPFFAECETCNGYGQVLTGSRDENNLGRDCPDCLGRGYLELLLDNTPAVELVKQWRDQRAVTPAPQPPVVLEPSPEPPAADARMGTPAWMGDTRLGQ